MAIPTLITELSATIGSNVPAGTEARTTADDYLRALAGFIAQLRDGPKNLERGTAAAPALQFDAGTGIYSTAEDEVAITAGGTQRLIVTAVHTQAAGLLKGRGGGAGLGQITVSTSAPSGGAAGDVWFRY